MFDAEKLVGLDFETYCALPLPEVGLARYVNHPTFMPTLASVAYFTGTHTREFPAENPKYLKSMLEGCTVSAHNAGFERAVLLSMGIDIPVIDSAVVAAVAGADRHLAGAARQLMNTDKLDEDGSLMNLFAKKQPGQVSDEFDRSLITKHPALWAKYKAYCERDAELSRGIVIDWHGDVALFWKELRYAQLTLEMNEAGWPVDIDSVHEMRDRYIANLDKLQDDFARNVDADLNLASNPQVKKWCADRGVTSRSFDKQNVERLIDRLIKLQRSRPLTPGQREVLDLLLTKQALGGSSLTKLKTILNTAHNGRVFDQYVHAGAPQSLRTSGRSIQMQNLPRLEHVRDMGLLLDPRTRWTNEELAGNLRQVFTSSQPDGQLLVADFASIESRALAYQAGETWKTKAYNRGEDVYKAQAMKIFKIADVTTVTKEQRTTGKVGELSCGYGAGPVAVKDFAAKMHVEMTESEAGKLVRDWRDANPCTVKYWDALGRALFDAVSTGRYQSVIAAHGIIIAFSPANTPASLLDQAPDVQSFYMDMWKDGDLIMRRTFHGCYLAGRDIRYYKPSSLKGGQPWKAKYVDPKTKRQVFYKLYGGKLAGILTQSMCREIFFESLVELKRAIDEVPNATIIGQFHDEVVIDWVPGQYPMEYVMKLMEKTMTFSRTHPQLPMGVEVKHDYRYTK
jgi:DNA polymerase bacteriophage-type